MKFAYAQIMRAADLAKNYKEWKRDPMEVLVTTLPLPERVAQRKSKATLESLCDLLWPGLRPTWRVREWHFWLRNNPEHLGDRLRALARQVQRGKV